MLSFYLKALAPSIGVLHFCTFLTIAWHSLTWEEHASFERPVQSGISILFLAGLVIIILSRTHLYRSRARELGTAQYVPLEEIGQPHPSREPSPIRDGNDSSLAAPARRRSFLVVVVAIIFRIWTLKKTSEGLQYCAHGVEITLLPILLFAYDYFSGAVLLNIDEDEDRMGNSIFDDFSYAMFGSRLRYLAPIFLISWGAYSSTFHVLPSTYIRSEEFGMENDQILFQMLGCILDGAIIIALYQLLKEIPDDRRRLSILGLIMIFSATVLLGFAALFSFLDTTTMTTVFNTTSVYKWGVFTDSLAVALVVFTVNGLIFDLRPLAIIVFSIFTSVFFPLVRKVWFDRSAFPPQSKLTNVLGLLCLYLGFISFMFIYRRTEVSNSTSSIMHRIPTILYVLIGVLFCIAEGGYMWRSNTVGFHPIHLMMYQAQHESEHWLKQASSSQNIHAAVTEYRARYRREPPPNFDKWFQFATERKVVITDDYDQIFHDLLPFWGMEPALIRQRTTIQHAHNDIVGIMIRNGEARATMLGYGRISNATITAISGFAKWLPDMNLAINMREEPQVAVPWSVAEAARKRARAAAIKNQGLQITNKWTPATDWKAFDNEAQKAMEGGAQNKEANRLSLSRWDEYIAPACPPSSKARRGKHWNIGDLCTTCSSRHSIGQFLSNWTAAHDICNQPDLAPLHSFLAAPASTSTTNYAKDELVPIFSKSKVQGYIDILIPTIVEYATLEEVSGGVDKVKSFSEMEDTLYWRGSAGEAGLYAFSWQGIQQQRLAHLANKAIPTDTVPMLFPIGDDKYMYENAPLDKLHELLKTSVGLSAVEKCYNEAECRQQQAEIGTINESQFEEHWRHRYLFDMDTSGGASEDFIPFLLSNGVPFRSSIFKTWYDDRLTAWLHYVPQDSRLHGLYSTLAYFVGMKGEISEGREVEVRGSMAEATWIAEQGRKRAEQLIRKVDAEAYLFRLLLEWGRVVSDDRERLGYKAEK